MRPPGFTAEASLAPIARRYRSGNHADRTSARDIAPQAGQVVDPECFASCITAGLSRLECFQACRRPAWV
jgi:hypothetical protein